MTTMNHRKKISVLFFANANTSRIVAQDLNAKDLIAHFDDRFHVYIFNSGRGEVDPKCLKPNVHIIQRQTLFQKLFATYYSVMKPMDYHFYIRSYQSRLYWWFKRLFFNSAVTIHSVEIALPYPAGDAYQKRARRNALNADHIFGLTDFINESVKKEYGRTVTGKIPIGVDTRVFYKRAVAREGNRIRVLSVGSLQPRKRPLFFVDAAKRFPDVDFVWIGDGVEKKRLLEKAATEQVDNFHLLAPMSHSELAREMNRSDIFFFPSKHEGLPKVVVEAMACGLPAIVFDDYKPEHVQDGISGYIVLDDDEACEKLSRIIESPRLRETLGCAAQKRAEAFSWERVADKWKQFLLSDYDGRS
jgi:glycosyltransferase involved in cell wall biosynthesis